MDDIKNKNIDQTNIELENVSNGIGISKSAPQIEEEIVIYEEEEDEETKAGPLTEEVVVEETIEEMESAPQIEEEIVIYEEEEDEETKAGPLTEEVVVEETIEEMESAPKLKKKIQSIHSNSKARIKEIKKASKAKRKALRAQHYENESAVVEPTAEEMDAYSRQKSEAAKEYKEQGKYLSTPINKFQIIMLSAAAVSIIILIILLLIFLSSKYQRFYFDNRPITYIFFVLIALLAAGMVGLSIINALSSGELPNYEEYKRMSKDLAEMKSASRFPELLDFDANHPSFEKVNDASDITLSKLCEEFRKYMSKELHLYYSIDDVRKFVSGMAISKMLILQGMSGTGKTSISIAFGKFIKVPSVVVPIQPMWKEKSDLIGYYNEFTGKFNETTILKTIYEALNSNKIFIIVLDEMNIARVEYYFSEFLSLLELPYSTSRELVIASSGAYGDPKKMNHGKILLPNNIWFLGTANNDDSTFAISDKVYDRAMIINLNNKTEKFEVEENVGEIDFSVDKFQELITQAQNEYALSEEMMAKLDEFDEYLIDKFQITFGNRIYRQFKRYVPVYLACGGSELQALDDLICKKLLRKLEGKNPVYLRSRAEELISKLDVLFGQDQMKDSIEYIRRITTV